MIKEQQAAIDGMKNRFEVLVGEIHELTDEMIVAYGLDNHARIRAATLNSWLELELPEYCGEKT